MTKQIIQKRFAVNPGWRVLLLDAGVDPLEVLTRAGLTGDLFARKETSLSPEEFFWLWDAMEQVFDDPAFPLMLMQSLSAEVFDPPIFAAYCSPNLNMALQRLSQYKPLICPMRLDVQISAKKARVDVVFPESEHALPVSLIAAELAFFVQLARMATRENIIPMEVTAPVSLPKQTHYFDFFGIEPKKGKAVSIAFSAADASRPFVTDNPQMWEAFEPSLKKRLADLTEEDDFADRVHSALLELLPSGRSTIDDVAEKLLVSKRTPQRRLKQEEINFQAVLNQVRERLARHYLANSSFSSNQISFLLGYDDPNSFFRAFHSWTGTTPETVRAASVH